SLRNLLSFPTRRSSDLEFDLPGDGVPPVPAQSTLRSLTAPASTGRHFATNDFPPPAIFPPDEPFSLALLPLVGPRGQHGYVAFRSEEHTSELQSRENLV